jgi:hypothetical protein
VEKTYVVYVDFDSLMVFIDQEQFDKKVELVQIKIQACYIQFHKSTSAQHNLKRDKAAPIIIRKMRHKQGDIFAVV